MSDDVSNKSGGWTLLPLAIVFVVLAVLASLVTWHRLALRQAASQAEAQRIAAIMAIEPPARETTPVSSYGAPDFLGEPEFDFLGNLETLGKAALETARAASPQIAQRRRATSRENSTAYGAIPAGAECPVERQFEAEYLQYRLRELEAYRSLTSDAGEAKAAGERFLIAYFREMGRGADGVASRELAHAALAAGSRDPLVRIYAAREEFVHGGDLGGVDAVWLECLQELSGSGYPRITSVVARTLLLESADLAPDGNSAERAAPLIVSIVRWLEEEGSASQWRGCTFSHLRQIWDNHPIVRSRLVIACLKSTRIDPYHVQLLAGLHDRNLAWAIRGGGYASSVKEEAWEPFYRQLRMAADHFEYAWLLDPGLPYAPAEMIGVSNVGQNIEDAPLDWFLRSVSARLDYYPAYSQYDYTLLSRWGGSIDQMVRFGRECLATNRFDTQVPYYLLQTLLSIQTWELDDEERLPEVVDLTPLLREFLDQRSDYRSRHPEVTLYGDIPYYRTRLAWLLELAELPADAASEVRELDRQLDVRFLQKNGRLGVFELRRLQAAQGPVRARVLAFDAKLRRPWSAATPAADAEALALELESLRAANPHESAGPYFRHAEKVIGQLAAFSAGEWAELSTDESGSGWEIHAETWEAFPGSNEIRMTRRFKGLKQAWARPLANFRPPFELEVELEAAEPPRYPAELGVQWQGRKIRVEGEAQIGRVFAEFRIVRNPSTGPRFDYVRFPGDQRKYGSMEPLTGPTRHTLRVRVWDRAYESLVEQAWDSVAFKEPLDPSGSLMFGENYPRDIAGGEIRLANARIRRLDLAAPPDGDADRDQQIAGWRSRVEADDSDWIAAIRLGQICLESGQASEALKLAEGVVAQSPQFARAIGLKGRALFRLGRYAEAKPLLIEGLTHRDDFPALAALAELCVAGPSELREPEEYTISLIETLKAGVTVNPSVTLAALAVDLAARGDFNAARDRNREAIAKATEPLKLELEARQKLYEADQPFELPQAAASPE